jgi:hypothetical protein
MDETTENMSGAVAYLHIFGQYTWHDEVQIVGTRKALEALAAAVAFALKYREAKSAHVFVNDGEGYTVHVKCVDDIGSDVPTPYTQDIANKDTAQWRERAFKAEIALSKLRREANIQRTEGASNA